MSVTSAGRLDEWGLRAAEQLETSVGAWVALASYKRLLEAAPPIGTRALLGALRCAAALKDDRELESLVARWSRAAADVVTDEPIAIARAELARGSTAIAAGLARAEVARRPGARSAYAAARLLEAALQEDAVASLERAQGVAMREGDHGIAAACAARRLEHLEEAARALPGSPWRAEAVAIVDEVDPAHAEGAVALWIARARLLAPGRFTRAGALSVLGDLVARGRPPVAAAAAAVVARHVDSMAARLTPLEAERAIAALRAMPEGAAREVAIARVEAVRAIAAAPPGTERDAAARAAAEADPTTRELAARTRAMDEVPVSVRLGRERFVDPFARLAALGVEALSALGARRSDAAIEVLGDAFRSVGPGEAIPAPLWVATRTALAARGDVRSAGAQLGAALIARAAGEPPEGFHAFGEALAAAGADEAALEATRRALRAREPGAAESMVRIAVAAAWRAHARGDVVRARTLLVEARAAAARP